MALRFHRSMKLLPGVRLNFGKRGIGISAGVRGLRVGVDSRGKGYTSAGIPGTGLSVRNYAKRAGPMDHRAGEQPPISGSDSPVEILLAVVIVLVIVAGLLALVNAR